MKSGVHVAPESVFTFAGIRSQDSPSKILEHGGAWHFKITQLKRRHALPEMVLFAVEGPQEGKQMEAYNEAVDMLSDTGAVVLPYNHQAEIVEFARA